MLISSSTLFQEFQNYQAYIEMHSLIFETDKTTISHPVPRVLLLLYKRILTLFQGFHFSSTRGYSPCSKGSNSPPQEDNLNSNEFTKRTWREQKPVVPVLVDLHHQYEVIHYQHEVAADVCLSFINFNQPILTSQYVQIFQNNFIFL